MVGGTEYVVLVIPERAGQAPRADLTAAERAVAAMVVEGLSNAAIAARRKTSARTVANQLRSIYGKFGVSSRLELAAAVGAIGKLQ
jgi:DNA-binding CsgD family transcriptional regulator